MDIPDTINSIFNIESLTKNTITASSSSNSVSFSFDYNPKTLPKSTSFLNPYQDDDTIPSLNTVDEAVDALAFSLSGQYATATDNCMDLSFLSQWMDPKVGLPPSPSQANPQSSFLQSVPARCTSFISELRYCRSISSSHSR